MIKKGKENTLFGAALFVVIVVVVWLVFLGGWADLERAFFTERIYVDAYDREMTIDRPETSVIIEVNGQDNEIQFSPETRIVEVTLKGTGNTVVLCEHQRPRLINQGVGNEILKRDCSFQIEP